MFICTLTRSGHLWQSVLFMMWWNNRAGLGQTRRSMSELARSRSLRFTHLLLSLNIPLHSFSRHWIISLSRTTDPNHVVCFLCLFWNFRNFFFFQNKGNPNQSLIFRFLILILNFPEESCFKKMLASLRFIHDSRVKDYLDTIVNDCETKFFSSFISSSYTVFFCFSWLLLHIC